MENKITVTKEEFLKEFKEEEWTPRYYSDAANCNGDCVSIIPEDLFMGVLNSFLNLNLHWSPKYGLLVFDDDWDSDDDWVTIDEYFEDSYFMEESPFLWSVDEFENLVCESAEKVCKKLWKEYITKEYEKINLGEVETE